MDAIDIVSSFMKVIAVFALLLLFMRALAKHQQGRPTVKGTTKRSASSLVEVLDQSKLGRTANVVAVRAGDRVFLLGVTDAEISVLADLSEDVDLTAYETGADQDRVLDHALDLLKSGSFRK